MVQVRWTEEAERWLHEIHDYIAADNPEAATRTVRGIYDKVRELETFPRMGARYAGGAESDVRILLYRHYRIAYHIKVATVEILGIYHGALDLDRLL